MESSMQKEQLQRCWAACWHRARRPVEGVMVSEEQASAIADRAIRNVSLDYEEFPTEAEFTARALEETVSVTKEFVAKERREAKDPQRFHDPEDRRYDKNLDLDRLQRRDPHKGFFDSEWNHLPGLLRPLALATLSRKGIKGPDAEDVFSDTLVELVRERESSGHAPILDPTVFEELIPLHARIVSFRSVDWYRRRGALKNQPNTGDSLDALTDSPDRAVQFDDHSSDPNTPTFERIYKECEEALSPMEWDLIFKLYVTQSATIQDLIGDDAFCTKLGIKPGVSGSTRRRVLSEMVEQALVKIRENLTN
jgi:DNA-directed RNA polymerase specialized sigma24 family protein